jgi:hypothetical protein
MKRNRSSSRRREQLASPIPGFVAGLRHIRETQTEIDILDIQQRQARGILDLDAQIASARTDLIKSLLDLDMVAKKVRQVFSRSTSA